MALFSKKCVPYWSRLFLWLVAYSLILVGSVVLFQYHREKQFKAEELNARLQQINSEILDDIDAGIPVEQSCSNHSVGGLRVSVINSAGRVIYDNSLDSLPSVNHQNREEIARAIAVGSGYSVRRLSQSTGSSYFYSARRGKDGIVVRTAIPYSVSLSSLLKADYGFLWVIGGITLIMCVLGYIATRKIGHHISRLREFAANAERGEPVYDARPFSHDELGDISAHIVRLYASLQQAIAERDREHQATLREQEDKVRLKKQLTNNINHELKTPVASIRVCLETLMTYPNLEESKRQDFMKRCLANCDRLSNLLNDVSTITRIDEGSQTIERRPVDLAKIIATVVDDMTPLAQNKGVTIANNTHGAMPLNGNASLLESVFVNLINNALSYSGGNRIEIVGGTDSDGMIRLSFSDNGCGVDPTHLPHLFERFYRIDKGRSRAAGGTGLGLSIVKNSIQVHQGEIHISNQPTGGLRFDIHLPSLQ